VYDTHRHLDSGAAFVGKFRRTIQTDEVDIYDFRSKTHEYQLTAGAAWTSAAQTAKTVTGITKANPGVVSSTSHGLSVGDTVFITGCTEMTELNNTYQVVTVEDDADNFSINDTSSYGAAETTGGDVVQQIEDIFVVRMYDQAGNSLTVEQTTDANQPKVIFNVGPKGYPALDFDGTNDYLAQLVEDDETGASFWPTNAGAAFNAGNARFRVASVDLAAAFADAANAYVLVIADSAGKKAHGYIDVADSAEALGSELWDAAAAVFTSGTYSWAVQGTNTIANVGNELQITYVNHEGGAYNFLRDINDLSSDLTVSRHYKLSVDAYYSGGSAGVRLEVDTGGVKLYSSNLTGSKTTYNFYFVATSAAAHYLQLDSLGASNVVYIDNLTLKEVTAVGADGVLIMSAKGGSTQSWTQQESGFDPNDVTSFNVVRSDFHAISTAMTVSGWVRLDDGTPAANNVVLAQHESAAGLRKLAFMVQTDGTLRAQFSSDGGGNSENEDTDAAVFPNGQTSWTHIAFVYNATTVVIYVNGAAVASTTGGGGIPASIHDSPELFTIGALSTPGSYLAGRFSIIEIFSTALAADRIAHHASVNS
jgi:hypothetical protein